MPADDYSPDGSMTFAEFQAQVLSDPEVFRHWLAAHDAELREQWERAALADLEPIPQRYVSRDYKTGFDDAIRQARGAITARGKE